MFATSNAQSTNNGIAARQPPDGGTSLASGFLI